MNKESDIQKLATQQKGDNTNANTEGSEIQKIHPNSLANLNPYPKGVSGNPSGRPKRSRDAVERLKEIGKERAIDDWFEWKELTKGLSNSEKALRSLWKKAIDGNIQSIKLLMDYGCIDNPKSKNVT